MKGEINIVLEGASLKETERCEAIIRQMFESGMFAFRNGKLTLHFDNDGMLAQVDADYIKWRRRGMDTHTLVNPFNSAIIESNSLTHNNERVIN